MGRSWEKSNPSLFFLQKYYIHGTKELEKYWWSDFNAKLGIASAKGIKEYLLLLSYCSCGEFSVNLTTDTAVFRTTKYPNSRRILESHLNFWFLNFLLIKIREFDFRKFDFQLRILYSKQLKHRTHFVSNSFVPCI